MSSVVVTAMVVFCSRHPRIWAVSDALTHIARYRHQQHVHVWTLDFALFFEAFVAGTITRLRDLEAVISPPAIPFCFLPLISERSPFLAGARSKHGNP